MTPAEVEAALRDACLAELRALKPGNVHVHAPGQEALLRDFALSAEVSAAALCTGPGGVGARVLRAVEATRRTVGHNTNLGIVLLAAPLAEAALDPGGGTLRERLLRVLARLDRTDAALAFRAIVLAAPAGLGAAPEHDVRDEPSVTLLEAMRTAASWDRNAAQYASAFADVFALGVPRLRGLPDAWAATSAFLGFLAAGPDSHVLRKFGPATAEAVRRRASALDAAIQAAGGDPRVRAAELRRFDRLLRRARVNPGTCADLTVASLFADRLLKGDTASTTHSGPFLL
ncbi:triphosphoribosyl-dephospho-CoA synthase [Azospirillum sp.]|uniref:triphosphoribosyl-dephospho-CoA synthase n=1 Tax=Azospirillum sp. TaxID=34012 RepID=UPI003D75C8C9